MRAQRFFEILDVRILERGDLDDAGVVDENVEAPAALNDCRDGASNVVRIADIRSRRLPARTHYRAR